MSKRIQFVMVVSLLFFMTVWGNAQSVNIKIVELLNTELPLTPFIVISSNDNSPVIPVKLNVDDTQLWFKIIKSGNSFRQSAGKTVEILQQGNVLVLSTDQLKRLNGKIILECIVKGNADSLIISELSALNSRPDKKLKTIKIKIQE